MDKAKLESSQIAEPRKNLKNMADYEHDIFISYGRSDELWLRWHRDNFVQTLSSLLRPRLGSLRVYMDESIDEGSSWPNHLARGLSRSRILVPVLSRGYFQSDWCRLELALMHDREQTGGLRCAGNPSGVIVPVTIDDGECFPPEVQAMQSLSLHDFANPRMRTDSPKLEIMAEKMRTKLCDSIEVAVKNAPHFDPAWESIAHEQFEGVFKVQMQSQTTLPSLSLPIS